MNKLDEFINGEKYEFPLRNIQKRSNIGIGSTTPLVLLDYDKGMLIAVRVEIEDLESLLNLYMAEVVPFVKRKIEYGFEDEDEYPEEEEPSDDERPRAIIKLSYYKNFLVAYLVEYCLFKKQSAELDKYLKRIHISHTTKYGRGLKDT